MTNWQCGFCTYMYILDLKKCYYILFSSQNYLFNFYLFFLLNVKLVLNCTSQRWILE